MKILPLVKSTRSYLYNNIKTTKYEFTKSQYEAKILAQRTEKIYKKNEYKKYLRTGRVRKLTKILTPVNLPIVGGIMGLATPIPFAGLALASVGAVAGLGIYLHDKYTQNGKRNKLHKA